MMKKVMVFGTFDGLHEGHFNFFRQARKYGDCLTAVVARDKNVERIKCHLPQNNEKNRIAALRNCQIVDKAVLGRQINPFKIIKKIKPDVICLGYDQKVFADNLSKELKKMNLKIKIYRLKPYKPQKYHSSLLINAIK